MNYTYPTQLSNNNNIFNTKHDTMIAVVLYINIHNTYYGLCHIKEWTQVLINICLEFYGRYYLPYQPLATKYQFEKACPEVELLRQMKSKYDPECLLQSQFIAKYIL